MELRHPITHQIILHPFLLFFIIALSLLGPATPLGSAHQLANLDTLQATAHNDAPSSLPPYRLRGVVRGSGAVAKSDTVEPMPATETDSYQPNEPSNLGSFSPSSSNFLAPPSDSEADSDKKTPWYHQQQAPHRQPLYSKQPEEDHEHGSLGNPHNQSLHFHYTYKPPVAVGFGLNAPGYQRNGISQQGAHPAHSSELMVPLARSSFNLGVASGAGSGTESTSPTPLMASTPTSPTTAFTASANFTESPFGSDRFRSIYASRQAVRRGGKKANTRTGESAYQIPPAQRSTILSLPPPQAALGSRVNTGSQLGAVVQSQVDMARQQMVAGVQSQPMVYSGTPPSTNVERYMPLLKKRLPHTTHFLSGKNSTNHPHPHKHTAAISQHIAGSADGGTTMGGGNVEVDWAVDGHVENRKEWCLPSSNGANAANCRTWITISIPGHSGPGNPGNGGEDDGVEGRVKFNRRQRNKKEGKDVKDGDKGGEEESESCEESEEEENGEKSLTATTSAPQPKSVNEESEEVEEKPKSESTRRGGKEKSAGDGVGVPPKGKTQPLRPIESTLPTLPPPKQPLRPVTTPRLPLRPALPYSARKGGTATSGGGEKEEKGGKSTTEHSRANKLGLSATTSAPSPSHRSIGSTQRPPWGSVKGGGGFTTTQGYKPEFVFSTRWILPINGLPIVVTQPPPITPPELLPLTGSPHSTPPPTAILTPLKPNKGGIGSGAGRWVRPFTLLPRGRPPIGGGRPSMPVIPPLPPIPQPRPIGETPPPLPPLPTPPPPTPPPYVAPAGRGAIVVSGVGPGGMRVTGGGGGNPYGNRPESPWTHGSTGSGSIPVARPERPYLPSAFSKTKPPVPTAETSIEQAAIWASTELIDAIKEALDKFRASINGPDAFHSRHPNQNQQLYELGAQIYRAWNELTSNTRGGSNGEGGVGLGVLGKALHELSSSLQGLQSTDSNSKNKPTATIAIPLPLTHPALFPNEPPSIHSTPKSPPAETYSKSTTPASMTTVRKRSGSTVISKSPKSRPAFKRRESASARSTSPSKRKNAKTTEHRGRGLESLPMDEYLKALRTSTPLPITKYFPGGRPLVETNREAKKNNVFTVPYYHYPESPPIGVNKESYSGGPPHVILPFGLLHTEGNSDNSEVDTTPNTPTAAPESLPAVTTPSLVVFKNKEGRRLASRLGENGQNTGEKPVKSEEVEGQEVGIMPAKQEITRIQLA